MIIELVISISLSFCSNEKAVLLEAADRIEEAYVLEDRARIIADDLREMVNTAKNKRQCGVSEDFAQEATTLLRETSGDGHFYLEALSNSSEDDWLSAWRESGKRDAYGIPQVEILEGNIGLIQITTFHELELEFSKYAAAFELVSDTDALIIDVRSNGGGSSQTAWPMQWTFLEAGSPSPLKLASRADPDIEREEPPVLWKRYGTKRPVAIVVDQYTFSAPEAFSFTLQEAGRAVVVGETTGGGAHMLDEGTLLAGGFTLYTPLTRPLSTRSGTNWEGSGISPDIAASSEEAVAVAATYLRKQLSLSRQ